MIVRARGAQHPISQTEKAAALRALIGELGYWDPLDLCRSKVIDEECNVPAAKDPGEAERAENEYDEQSFKKESACRLHSVERDYLEQFISARAPPGPAGQTSPFFAFNREQQDG
jgi:hypothetical protein